LRLGHDLARLAERIGAVQSLPAVRSVAAKAKYYNKMNDYVAILQLSVEVVQHLNTMFIYSQAESS